MPKKVTQIIKEETVDDPDSRAVLAYRVGQLEKTTAQGFKEIKDELHRLQNSFVTSAELKEAKDAATNKHIEQDARITKLEAWNEWAVKIVLGAIFLAVIGLVLVKTPTIGG